MCPQAETGRATRTNTANTAGEKALARGELSAAEEAFTAAIESLGKNAAQDRATADAAAAAHLGLGRVCLARNDFRAADLRFDQVQRLSPSKPDGYYWGGCVAAHQVNYRRAEWLFSAALDRDAQLGKAYLQRAYVRLRQRQDDLALTDLLTAADYECTDDNARLLTAALLLRNGDRTRAQAFTAEVDPDSPGAAVLRGIARHQQATAHDARREQALALREAALAAAQQGDWTEAASLLRHRDSVIAGIIPGEPDLIEAVIHGLGGDRSKAIDLLGQAAIREPADHRIAHAQAVMQLHTLSAGPTPPENMSWQSCIGAWVSVLNSEAFWQEWPQRAQRRYGRAIPANVVQSVRAAVREFIEDRLSTNEMSLLLRRELEAARSLDQLGGLPVGESPGERLVCGPLRIAEVGMHRRLSEFLKVAETGGDVENVRRQFSHLGLAEVHLAMGRPREATRIALDLRCPSCAQATVPSTPAMISDPLLCEPDCPEFDLRNPAFCALADKHDRLSRSSGELAAGTLLGIARSDITSSDMDLADARKCWRAAVTLATGFGRRAGILRVAVDDALGRAKSLTSKQNWADAIAVLEAVLIVIPASDSAERDRVTHVLALLLNTRGVRRFREDRTRAESACADLRRAVALSPHLKAPRLNLGVVLRAIAYRALDTGERTEGIGLLREAVDQFELGLAARPGDRELRGEVDGTRADLDIALGRPWPEKR
jgi:cellulose synthase operon protein C